MTIWPVSSGRTQTPDRPLRWGSDAEGGAPYIFKDPQNPERNKGFEVDLAEALARELGRPIVFKQYDFESLFEALKRNDIDLAMDGLEVLPERIEQVRFSRPYYIYKLQLVVRVNEDRFQTLDEFKSMGGNLVGTMIGTAAERLLKEKHFTPKSYQAPREAYRDLALGRTDAVLLDLPIALYYAKPLQELKFAGEPIGKGYYAIAFAKNNEALAQEFDAALNRLLANGELQRIYEKWHLWNEDQKELGKASVADLADESDRLWSWPSAIKELGEGAWVTVQISVASMALAIALGLLVALARLYGPWPLPWLATAYVEFFRGIPVLMLLFVLYFGLPTIARQLGLGTALDLPPFWAAVVGFGMNYAAYEAEIYRGGIGSIPDGQWEAAASLGMSRILTFRRIILPQAVRVILPPMTNDFVALFKDTSIVSIIALEELSKRYQILAKSSGQYVELGLITAALYLIMSVPLGYLSRYLEKRWNKEGGL
jgi:polar amino acid transport system substrate-binding protein